MGRTLSLALASPCFVYYLHSLLVTTAPSQSCDAKKGFAAENFGQPRASAQAGEEDSAIVIHRSSPGTCSDVCCCARGDNREQYPHRYRHNNSQPARRTCDFPRCACADEKKSSLAAQQRQSVSASSAATPQRTSRPNIGIPSAKDGFRACVLWREIFSPPFKSARTVSHDRNAGFICLSPGLRATRRARALLREEESHRSTVNPPGPAARAERTYARASRSCTNRTAKFRVAAQ